MPINSDIITYEKFKDLTTNKLKTTEESFGRLIVVCISIIYYGLLRQGEVHVITTRNVKFYPKKKIIRI